MANIQEIINGDGYYIITFLDENEVYGMLLCEDYVEFMEIDEDGEFLPITEEDAPEEFDRLKEKYIDELIDAIDED